MTEDKIKHLEFIQNIITRMNSNSFQIKEWSIAIITGILAIYISTQNYYFLLAGIIPTVLFWFLDTYYLTQERKFRGLYNDVAGVSENPKDIKPFAMRPDLYTKERYSYWNVFWSRTIWPLHFTMVIILCSLFVYLKFFSKC